MRKRCVWKTAIGVLGCVLVGVCGLGTVRAQNAVTIDVADCIKLTSAGDRLNCYERHAEAAQKAATPPTGPAPATEAVPPHPAPAAAAAASAAAAPAATAAVPAAAIAPAAASGAAHGAAPAAPPPAAPSAGAASSSSGGQSGSKALPPDVVATITDLRVTVPNSYRITLDNGQVWQQTYPETYPLQTGQRVTLQASKWGKAYRLSGEGMNGFIQVQRVR